MALFGDKKFEPTPVTMADITSCYQCRCLIFQSSTKRVLKITIVGNSTTRITDHYCHRCAPPYHEIVYYFSGDIKYQTKPIKIQYFKTLNTPSRVECNENGEVVEANTPGMV